MDDWDLFADYRRFRQNPVRFAKEWYSIMHGVGFSEYKDYIGMQLFSRDWYTLIKTKTLNQPKLIEMVNQQVEDEVKQANCKLTKRQLRQRKLELLNAICSKSLPRFSQLYGTRFAYFFFSQILPRGYQQGMHISKFEIERLKNKAQELQQKKQSLVLLPCHKSHCDYIALVYIFFRINLSIPATIAGDNLDIPLVSWFLRQLGATFIRRGNWKDDKLYVSFFQSLVNTYLQQGMNIQCFIEGTRSRTGKLLPPKFGILKFILESVMSDEVEDCWIVPISTQYDKALEGDAYASELMGKEKKSENLKSFFESRSLFKTNLGRIDVRISEGFSLREFVNEQLRLNAPRPIILRQLAYKVLNDINGVSVVMPSALVGTVLLTTRQPSLSKEDLVYRVCRLIERITSHNGKVGALSKPENELTNNDIALLVNNALDVLGPDLVKIDKNLLEPICYPRDTFKLSYYRNQVVHLFVAESLVCICLYQFYLTHLSLEVPISTLKQNVAFLSKVLSGEFVFNNDDTLVGNLLHTFGNLKRQHILESVNDQFVKINPQEVSDGWVFTHFYTYLVWPFIDGYWSGTMALQMLPYKVNVNLKQFYKVAQQVANTLYHEGALSHLEACNLQIIQSVVSQAALRGYLKVTKNTIMLVVDPKEVGKVCDELALFRNEFMKRPAGSHLVTRVEELGRGLMRGKL